MSQQKQDSAMKEADFLKQLTESLNKWYLKTLKASPMLRN
jgi:hypothetical protein